MAAALLELYTMSCGGGAGHASTLVVSPLTKTVNNHQEGIKGCQVNALMDLLRKEKILDNTLCLYSRAVLSHKNRLKSRLLKRS